MGWLFALLLSGAASADDDAATVLLEARCVECHHQASPKGGLDLSTRAAEDKTHVHDIHATILHLLGIDHTKLTFRHQGRAQRLTDVAGTVIRKALA